VRRDAAEDALLSARLAHQPDASLRQVAYAAVQQSARPARRAEREVALLDQRHTQPAHRRVARHARADNPATDHQHIDIGVGERMRHVSPG